MTTLTLTPITPGVPGLYPGSTTYPGATTFPGSGIGNLSADSAGTLTLAAKSTGTLTLTPR